MKEKRYEDKSVVVMEYKEKMVLLDFENRPISTRYSTKEEVCTQFQRWQYQLTIEEA